MTLLGLDVEQARARYGWRGLLDFAANLPGESATVAAVSPEYSTRNGTAQAIELLASLFDGLAWLQYSLLKRWGGAPQKPRPYPLQWRAEKRQKIGAGGIPVADFENWYYGRG